MKKVGQGFGVQAAQMLGAFREPERAYSKYVSEDRRRRQRRWPSGRRSAADLPFSPPCLRRGAGGRPGADRRTLGWFSAINCGYGTVGTWPAFSWASRAALSVASWAAASFDTNVPGVDA